MGKQWRVFLLGVMLLLAMATTIFADAGIELNVSAAISLKDSLLEIQKSYEPKHPGVKLVFNLNSSGALQTQIEQGAPADVFISAAIKQMDALEKKNLLVKGTRFNLLENQLVLIVPKGQPTVVKEYKDLAADSVKKIAIGAPESVPAGQYAQEVFKKIGIWEKVKDKTVLGTNVRAVLTYVETGNVDAGVVYRTDAAISDKVRIVTYAPVGSHEPIIYPAAVLTDAKQPKAAAEFLAYLRGAEGKSVFEKYGFVLN